MPAVVGAKLCVVTAYEPLNSSTFVCFGQISLADLRPWRAGNPDWTILYQAYQRFIAKTQKDPWTTETTEVPLLPEPGAAAKFGSGPYSYNGDPLTTSL